MILVPTALAGLYIIEPKVFEDDRGYFFESFNEHIFQQNSLDIHWVQDNQSKSSYGVLRGLHYQLEPYAQTKLVRVVDGEIIDIKNSAEKVASFTFHQGAFSGKCTSDIMSALAKKIGEQAK